MRLRGNKFLRTVDAVIGRFLVWILSLFKFQRAFPQKIDSIGFLKLSGIGDLVLLSGVINDVRRAYPNTKLFLFCGLDNRALADLIPFIDQIIEIPLHSPLRAFALMRKYRPTILIDFGQWSRIDALLTYGAGSLYTVGFKTLEQNRHYLYDSVETHLSEIHEIENFRSLVKSLGVYSLSSPLLQLKPIHATFSPPANKYFLFHPWPSGIHSHLKEWPMESWIELGVALVKEGYHIVISGGKEDISRSQLIVNQINARAHFTCAFNKAGVYSLNELGYLIQGATGVVSVNTGIMHMAACFPVPLIGLHGPTSIKRWGPLGPYAIAIAPTCRLCGYLNLGFEYPKNPPQCMAQIPVKQVLDKCLKLILMPQDLLCSK